MNIIGGRSVLSHVNYSWPAAALVLAVTVAALVASAPAASGAVAAVGLGTAGSFGVLSGSTVTNTGQSVVHGDLGVSPGTAVTGFAPGIVTGAEHRADGVAAGAQSDLTTAYNVAAGESPSGSVGPFLGAGATIVAGVYNATTSLDVGGTLTLDGQGNPDAVFIFQVGSTLVTDSASDVILINGAQACHVFWQVGSSATLGTHSAFQGSVLALQSISVQTGDTINGRMLARNGAVTLDDDTITVPGCAAAPTPPPTTTGPAPAPTTTGPAPVPTSTAPAPVPTTTAPAPAPTTTAPAPAPSTGPVPRSNVTSPVSTPVPTTTRIRPTPTPTTARTGMSPALIKSAPTPTPVSATFAVTG
jgi:Ice-binding-like